MAYETLAGGNSRTSHATPRLARTGSLKSREASVIAALKTPQRRTACGVARCSRGRRQISAAAVPTHSRATRRNETRRTVRDSSAKRASSARRAATTETVRAPTEAMAAAPTEKAQDGRTGVLQRRRPRRVLLPRLGAVLPGDGVRMNDDLSYDVDYDDGYAEKNLPAPALKPPKPFRWATRSTRSFGAGGRSTPVRLTRCTALLTI